MTKTIEVINNKIKITEIPTVTPIVTYFSVDQLLKEKSTLEARITAINVIIQEATGKGAKTAVEFAQSRLVK